MCGTFSLPAAIEAMKNAHKEEMEKTHRSQLSGINSDIDELRLQYEYVALYSCIYYILLQYLCFIVLTQTHMGSGGWRCLL